jgi:FKBP12-rapamycin complex-associated protein
MKFMREYYIQTGENILRFKGSKDTLVRQSVISLIPTMAIYDASMFVENFMHKCMGHLLGLLDKAQDRARGQDLKVVP